MTTPTLATRLINGHRTGTPDMLPRRDARGYLRTLEQCGMRPLYLTKDVQAGVYQDRAGHVWTFNSQVGWVLGSSDRYLRECYKQTLARRYRVAR